MNASDHYARSIHHLPQLRAMPRWVVQLAVKLDEVSRSFQRPAGNEPAVKMAETLYEGLTGRQSPSQVTPSEEPPNVSDTYGALRLTREQIDTLDLGETDLGLMALAYLTEAGDLERFRSFLLEFGSDEDGDRSPAQEYLQRFSR